MSTLTAWLLALVLAGPASAQELDATGLEAPPDSHDPRDAPWSWSPGDDRSGTGTVSVGAEYTSQNAVRTDTDGERTDTVVLLDQLIGARIGGLYDLGPVAFGASLPLWLGAGGTLGEGGFALGDAHLWVPIRLHAPPRGRPGWGLAAVPYAGLPTGDATRLLGDAFSPGLLGSFELRGRKAGLTASLGGELDGAQEDPVPGGPKLRLGLGGHYALTSSVAAHLEARAAAQAPGNVPAEVAASLKARHPSSGLWLEGGVGTGISDGLGAAPLRAWLSAGFGPASRAAQLEAVPMVLEVRDPDGTPVRGAEVRQGTTLLGTTDVLGQVAIPRDLDWRTDVQVAAPGMVARTLAVPAVDALEVQTELAWGPVALHVLVADASGKRLPNATIAVDGPERALRPDPARTTWELPPGTWTVSVAAPGMGRQVRTLTVEPGRRRAMELEILLQPTQADGSVTVAVLGADQTPLEGARVAIDGADLGTVGGGDLVVEGLARGTHTARVDAVGYAPIETELAAGTRTPVALLPTGSPVSVVVRDAQGRPTNASLVLRGPDRIAPQHLGADGTATVALTPGTWRVEVEAPTFGSQERTIEVTQGAESAEFVLLPDEGGDRELVLHVVDAAGMPVDQAEVALDGQTIGRSSNTGELRLTGLGGGEREVVIEGEGLTRTALTVASSETGLTEVDAFVDFLPGTVEIAASGGDALPVDARIAFQGPTEIAPMALGPDGTGRVQLPEGTWTITIAGDGMAPQIREVVVGGGVSRNLVEVGMDRAQGTGELALRVTDPSGGALAGALLRIDEVPRGTTTEGSAVLGGMAPGTHTVEVSKVGYGSRRVEVEVPEGRAELDLELPWNGVLKLVARAGAEPVADAVVRLAGPLTVPPTRLEAGGTLFPLGPGTWDLLVSSAAHGMRQDQVELGGEQTFRELTIDLGHAPDEEAVLLVRVQDDLRLPVADAEVLLDGNPLGTTSSGGALLASGRTVGAHRLEVLAAELEAASVEVELAPGSQQRHLRMSPLRTPVTVTLIDPPPAAEVWVEGPHPAEPEPGTRTYKLGPGRWFVMARGTGSALHRRVLDVPHGWWQPMEVQIPMGTDALGRSVTAIVTDADGLPVSGAELTVDGVLAGTTDRGGRLELPEVPDGAATLVARSDARASLQVEDLPAVPGAHVVHLQLGWLPGSVKVVARDRDGRPVNAAAGFRGPRRLRPIPLGERGQRVFVLPEGTWSLDVGTEGMGSQERRFTVDSDDELIVIEAILGPDQGGPGELAIRVLDPEGQPIDGAAVAVDGHPVGRSTNLGELRLFGLTLGSHEVGIAHGQLREGSWSVDAIAGLTELDALMRWRPGSVKVTARGPDAQPIDAVVRLRGPGPVDPVQLGDDGTHRFALDPGSWDMVVSSPDYGMASRRIEVRRDQVQARDIIVALIPPEATVVAPPAPPPPTVRVVATAKGAPVTDAILRTSGPEVLPPMALDDGGMRELPLAPGIWRVLVSSPMWGMQEQEVRVARGAALTDLRFEMARAAADEAVLLLRIQDEDRRPVAGAAVSLGDRELGRTSASGALLATGLQPGPAELSVRTTDALEDHVETLELAAGSAERSVVLRWPRTEVALTVTDRGGRPLAAAEVQLTGPEDVAPIAVTDGSGEVALRPGDWTALATSPERAPSQQTLTLAPGDGPKALSFRLASAKAEVGEAEITIQERVHFEVDSAVLRADSGTLLDEVAGLILANPGIVQLEIGGHTDDTGGRQYNLELSQKRAQAVRDALIAKGVFEGMLVAKGYGLSQPVAPNDTPDGRAANRRVQFEILEWVKPAE